MEAGTALLCVLRLLAGYKGAFCYVPKPRMGEAVIAPRGEPPVAIPLADLAEGNPRAQSNFETADRARDN